MLEDGAPEKEGTGRTAASHSHQLASRGSCAGSMQERVVGGTNCGSCSVVGPMHSPGS